MTTSPKAPAPATVGPVARAVRRLFLRDAEVSEVEDLPGDFRLLTFVSAGWRALEWSVGQKLQIAVGSGLQARTYTPMRFDRDAGSLQVLAYQHGDGPGSVWMRAVRRGDRCQLFGPRGSLELDDLPSSVVLFGDETSLGLSAAVESQRGTRSVRHIIETSAADSLPPVLERVGLANAEVHARSPGDHHLDAIEGQLSDLAAQGAHFVLTGHATSIQRLRRLLLARDVPRARIQTKAYWAPGKTGLD